MSFGGRFSVHCPETGGCLCLKGIISMAKSIGVALFVCCIEVVHISEHPLWECSSGRCKIFSRGFCYNIVRNKIIEATHFWIYHSHFYRVREKLLVLPVN